MGVWLGKRAGESARERGPKQPAPDKAVGAGSAARCCSTHAAGCNAAARRRAAGCVCRGTRMDALVRVARTQASMMRAEHNHPLLRSHCPSKYVYLFPGHGVQYVLLRGPPALNVPGWGESKVAHILVVRVGWRVDSSSTSRRARLRTGQQARTHAGITR